MAKLTRQQLILNISEETGLQKNQVFEVIQKTLESITEALATGQNVELRNFGVFEVTLTKARPGRNPLKPEKQIMIPSRAMVKFQSGKVMRERVLELTKKMVKQKK